MEKIPIHTPKKINIKFSDKATEAKILSMEKAKSIISIIKMTFQKESCFFSFFYEKKFFSFKK